MEGTKARPERSERAKRVLLAPLDPVHDIGLKMIRQGLRAHGHETVLLPPDVTPEEIVQAGLDNQVDVVLISRTVGYGVAESLGRLIDLAEATGLRNRARMAIGGMAIRPELGAELGFNAAFGPGTTVDEAIAFVEGHPYICDAVSSRKIRQDITEKYDYAYRHDTIGKLLEQTSELVLRWVSRKTSPGVIRANLRREMLEAQKLANSEPGGASASDLARLRIEYAKHCDSTIAAFHSHEVLPPRTRMLAPAEVAALQAMVSESHRRLNPVRLQHQPTQPLVFIQYGTGCPLMDITHIKVGEGWGADGVVHFDPSWGARSEGLVEGYISHAENGTVVTPENLRLIGRCLEQGTLWQVRAHRGLNTPETVVLAAEAGAHLTKISIAYGSLGGGTDPARLTVDGVAAIRLAAEAGMPFDVVTNDELSGVPAFKAFTSMLIIADLGRRLGGKPILQPLFCYSPEVMINGRMADNYVDFNAAKVLALRSIINAPIWLGAPIGFLTQTEDRVQSSTSTALHAGLAASLGVDAISIASSDEAYSGGPITAQSRVDTLHAVREVYRFLGSSNINPSPRASEWAEQLTDEIQQTLREVIKKGCFVQALYDGVLGSREDGAYPGRAGRDTVISE